MRRFIVCAGCLAAVLLAASGAAAAGDAAAGKAKSGTCAGCHGSNGISGIPNYPNLAGQKEPYLAQAMKDYKTGARGNATMKAMVQTLSDADLENLAAYYAQMDCK